MAKVISCAHEKGGVGKTTTTVNLGIGLARQGKKVLLIDADPQGDLSKCLGIENPNAEQNTLATAMNGIIMEEDFSPTDMVFHHNEGVDFVPANSQLATVEVSLVNSMSREQAMRQYVLTFIITLFIIRNAYKELNDNSSKMSI